MKRVLAVALLLLTFASAALADGPGMSPPPGGPVGPPKPGLLADGPGISPPPAGVPSKLTGGEIPA
jgi:hypothetical protein